MPVNTVCPVCSKTFLVKPYVLARVGKTRPNPPCCSRNCALAIRVVPTTTTHGHTSGNKYTKEYTAWYNMKTRCGFKKDTHYPMYGGRGIKVCDQWLHSFENFLADLGYSPSSKHTLGRIDNDGDYCPSNVEWQLPEVQVNNKSTSRFITAFGKTQTLQQWARQSGLTHNAIYYRIKRGWPTEDAVSTPNVSMGHRSDRLITFRGITMNLADWAKETGIDGGTIAFRIKKGWSIKDALTRATRVCATSRPKLL